MSDGDKDARGRRISENVRTRGRGGQRSVDAWFIANFCIQIDVKDVKTKPETGFLKGFEI